jgi:hypothetical protein
MTELPFEKPKTHKYKMKYKWKSRGMKFTKEEFEYWYNKYIYATHCELCEKQFIKSIDRHLDHNHDTGEIRNIVCCKCNQRKYDKKLNSRNTTGYSGIYKYISTDCKQGFYWEFYAYKKNSKRKYIKSSTDFDWLVKFAEKWKKENNYYT